MATTIFYFTGTGNSLKVACDLANEFTDTNLISIPKAINQEKDLSADCIGIVYPVYMFGIPLIVKEFIKRLKAKKDTYIFAIVTNGGMAADTLGQNARLLKAKGLRLSAGFNIRMPGNYTPLYEAIAAEKQNKLFEKEKQRIKDIAQIIKERKQNNIEKGPLLANLILSNIVYNLCAPKIPVLDKSFWVNKECTGCGICEKVCPVNNIKFSNGKPFWLHKCQQCFACFHWCPKEAIQYGKKTLGRKRYRNPEVKLEDLISSNKTI